MNQLKKQISEKEETTSKPTTNLLAFNGFTQLKKLLKGLTLLTLILIVSLVASALSEIPSKAMGSSNEREVITINNESTQRLAYIANVRNISQEKLIAEVESYMKSIAPTNKLDARLLVNLCNQYNMDVIFVIAQGILESHLGTKGMAVNTNSVWNVGTYDNGKIHYTYKNPNESIEPYLKLLREKYLIKISQRGDTISREIKNLIQDRGFTNSEGKRYASSTIYENSLRNMMIKVNMESSISLYQGISDLPDDDIFAFFSPIEQAQDSVFLAKL